MLCCWTIELGEAHSSPCRDDRERSCKRAWVRSDSVHRFSSTHVLSSSSSRLGIDESISIEEHLEPLRIYLLFLFDCSESSLFVASCCRRSMREQQVSAGEDDFAGEYVWHAFFGRRCSLFAELRGELITVMMAGWFVCRLCEIVVFLLQSGRFFYCLGTRKV
jgi:hypothetical protein